jgi:hypothetical protein
MSQANNPAKPANPWKEWIDYNNATQVRSFRSITLGAVTANVGAVISLTLITERPAMLEWALMCFAASLPLLVSCAISFDRVLTRPPAGSNIDGWLRFSITTCTLAALTATNCGYMFIMWHYSNKALYAYNIATFVGVALIAGVASRIRLK